jgi:intracellular septation protein A
MEWQLFFLSVAPVFAYVALWASGRPRAGIVAAIVVAAAELAFNSLRLGFIEPFSLLSLGLFATLGAWSIAVEDDRPFKLQPVLFELCCAAALVYYLFILETPLLAVVLEDYVRLHDVLDPYQRGYATVYATTLSRSLPFVLVLHAAITAYVAWTRSTWWWFSVRVLGFYLMVGLLFVGERLMGVTP